MLAGLGGDSDSSNNAASAKKIFSDIIPLQKQQEVESKEFEALLQEIKGLLVSFPNRQTELRLLVDNQDVTMRNPTKISIWKKQSDKNNQQSEQKGVKEILFSKYAPNEVLGALRELKFMVALNLNGCTNIIKTESLYFDCEIRTNPGGIDVEKKIAGVVMPFVPNHFDSWTKLDVRPFTTNIKRVKFSRLRSALTSILNGIWQMHQFGLAHLDIKPGNVLVEDSSTDETVSNPKIFIIDFGTGELTAEPNKCFFNAQGNLPTYLRMIGTFAGTEGYIPPEIINLNTYLRYCLKNELEPDISAEQLERAKRYAFSKKADIFGFGRILHKVFIGGERMADPDIVTKVIKRIETHFDVPEQEKDQLKLIPEIIEIIKKCTSHEPRLRPPANKLLNDYEFFAHKKIHKWWVSQAKQQQQQQQQ